jgi:RNA-binding protein 25
VKKIIEYLGEEEESLTNFMVGKLQAHCKPQELLEELQFVLDDDSEQFVLKLWRIMIYHSIRVTLN